MAGLDNGVPQKSLSFLPHSWKKPDGSTVSLDSLDPGIMNLPFMTDTDTVRNPGLQTILDQQIPATDPLRSDGPPKGRGLRFALVDLTGDKLNSPQFAGHREKDQGGLGSMAKLACMCAAFQLKFDLETLGVSDLTALFKQARDNWNDTQIPGFDRHLIFSGASPKPPAPGNPKIDLLGKLVFFDAASIEVPRPASSPDLERIFKTPPASGSLAFDGSDRILVGPQGVSSAPDTNSKVENYVNNGGGIAALRDPKQDFSFAERLFLMIDNSDDPATQTCVENVSFLYIASTIWQSGLYNPRRGGGLWQGTTQFDGPGRLAWARFDKSKPNVTALPPVPQGADAISGTAASIAAMLTLIAQGRLVSQDASGGMKHLMSRRKQGLHNRRGRRVGSYTRSFFNEGLSFQQEEVDNVRRTPRFVEAPVREIYSKIGIADFSSDCALVVRQDRGKELRYIAAGFDSTQGAALLRRLIVRLDMCIQQNNGLTPWNGIGTPPVT